MTFNDIITFYGNNITKAAAELGYTTATLYEWRKKGVPWKTQVYIQAVTLNQLIADKGHVSVNA